MPSLAILSRFGVRPAIMPRWYAPMFHMPMSSPMMTRMLGCLAGACARAGDAIDSAAARPTTAARHFRNKFFIGLPVWSIRRLAGLREALVYLGNGQRGVGL